MTNIRALLLASTLLAAVGASPAHATLQIAASIGPDAFFCADGQACDTSGTSNLIITGNTVLDGILFSSSSASSASGAVNFLNASNLLITNTNDAPVNITITVSSTDYTAPSKAFTDANSGVWQGGALSTATFKWFIDPANAQGADNAGDTPGVLVDTALSTSTGPVLAFSRNNTVSDTLDDPFSMTEQITLHLGAGESLVNRGQTIIGSAVVPEPSTWAMMLVGFIGLAWGAVTRKRLRLY
jgi:PEP-CTERM motif